MKEALQRAARARLSGGRARGFFFRVALLLFACALLPSAHAQESVCAEVKIEIKQTVTLERQAFDARLKIRNGLSLPVEAIDVSLRFADADGVAVPATTNPDDSGGAKFFFRTDGTTDITGELTGTGVVAPEKTGEAHWLIVPTATAGGQTPDGVAYRVGATITYRIGSETKTVEVTPDTITVKPQPKLKLDYFLTHHVYGDDPFTPATEPQVPFTLGVRVWNYGYGRANAVAIESGQPEIRKGENRQGLLIDFRILDSYVDDAPLQPTLTPVFGEIVAGKAKMGRWNMTVSLSGIFYDFVATIRHADEFGGALTSLIASGDIKSHELVRDVLADAPGRDGVRDFLALDADALNLYESDSGLVPGSAGATSVTEVSATLAGGGNSRQLTVAAVPNGFVYVKIVDPFSGNLDTISARRIDGGKTIPAANVWFSKERNAAGTGWLYFLNVFDFHDASLANQVTYRLDAETAPVESASLRGAVYEDVDGDSLRDAEEPAMLDVEMTLSGTDAFGGSITRTTRSDALGGFAFTQLPAGTFRIDVGSAPGYRDGTHTVGTAGGNANAHGIDGIALASGATASGYAFAKTRGDEAPDGADFVLAGIEVDRSGLVAVGGGFGVIVRVRNDGFATASAAVHIALPADFNVLNATPLGGDYDAATKTWRIGPTQSGGTHQLVLTLVPTQAGARTIGANVVVDGPAIDPRPANNARTFDLTVHNSVPLGLVAAVDKSPRVLVYASCVEPPGDIGERRLPALKAAAATGACVNDRAAGFDAIFTALGVEHYVATSDAELRRELRSGRWDFYWISAGTAPSLSVETMRELAQAQLRDEWMIVDLPRGHSTNANDAVERLESYIPAEYQPLRETLRLISVRESRFLPEGGLRVHGLFAHYHALGSDVETIGTLYVQDEPPAIQRINRTLLFSFDLYLALADNPTYRAAFLTKLLRETRPQFGDAVVAGQEIPLDMVVSSYGRAADVTVSLEPPAGFEFVSSTPAPVVSTPSLVQWSAGLGATDSSRIRARLRAQTEVQDAYQNFYLRARSTDPSVDDEVSSGSVVFQARALASMETSVRLQLEDVANALPILTRFDVAAAEHAAGHFDAALAALLDVSDMIDDDWRANGLSASIVPGELGMELGRLLRAWQIQATPPAAPCAPGACVLRGH